MKTKIIVTALVAVLFLAIFTGAEAALPEITIAQSDEYKLFIPFVLTSRCVLPESTKAECLQ